MLYDIYRNKVEYENKQLRELIYNLSKLIKISMTGLYGLNNFDKMQNKSQNLSKILLNRKMN